MRNHVAHLNFQDVGHNFIAYFWHLFSLVLSGNSTFYCLFGKVSILVEMRDGKRHNNRFSSSFDLETCYWSFCKRSL